jgi:PPM family protein phosphatase
MGELGIPAAVALLDITTLSHVGHVRQRNEDHFFSSPAHGLSVVADGVGGQGDGAWASREAIRLFIGALAPQRWPLLRDAKAAIDDALNAAHTTMCAANRSLGAASGTTIAGVWAPLGADGDAIAFNIGDSCVFHFSGGALTKVSHDHSLYQLWVDGGCTGREPGRRSIVQAMGISETLAPYVETFRVRRGESVLLCTDGLSGALSHQQITARLEQAGSSRTACEKLLADVLAGPAADNVTVSVCSF